MWYQTEVDMAIHPKTQKTAIHSFVKYLLNSNSAPGFMSTTVTGRSASLAAMCGHVTKVWPTDADTRNVSNFCILLYKEAACPTSSFSLPRVWK